MWNSTMHFHFWGVPFKIDDLVRIFENQDVNIMMLDFATHMKSGTVTESKSYCYTILFQLIFQHTGELVLLVFIVQF